MKRRMMSSECNRRRRARRTLLRSRARRTGGHWKSPFAPKMSRRQAWVCIFERDRECIAAAGEHGAAARGGAGGEASRSWGELRSAWSV